MTNLLQLTWAAEGRGLLEQKSHFIRNNEKLFWPNVFFSSSSWHLVAGIQVQDIRIRRIALFPILVSVRLGNHVALSTSRLATANRHWK